MNQLAGQRVSGAPLDAAAAASGVSRDGTAAPGTTPGTTSSTTATPAAWHARLDLCIERRGAASVLARRRHSGPLRVQKALYPEGGDLAHLILIHPPAGIAAGDQLDIDVRLAAGSAALVTTPGAAKWYRANGRGARQSVRLALEAGAALEWLPQETILFDGADARIDLAVDCAHGARFLGWETIVFGRRAAGEVFARGRLRQKLELRHAGRLVWRERTHVAGGDALFNSPVGWDGASVAGVLWAFGSAIDDAAMQALRAIEAPGVRIGATRLTDELLVVRALSDSSERLRAAFVAAWSLLRPIVLARAAQSPRIWAT
jgi:urease accessory protein